MSVSYIGRLVALLAAGIVAFAVAPAAFAEPYVQGPTFCEECHKDQAKTWATTKHFTTYRTVHKSKDAKKIVKAVGGKKSMKRNKACNRCHYSVERKKPTAKPKVRCLPDQFIGITGSQPILK